MRTIELFSCAGGMAEGFRRAGLPLEMAFDRDPVACATYAPNLGHSPVVMDVHDLLRMTRVGWSPGALDLVVADTPCQPWSRADWTVSALPDGRLPNAIQLSTQAGAILQVSTNGED